MFTDPISDFLTRIRNAHLVRHEVVSVPGSHIKRAIADILQREGYIESVEEQVEGAKRTIIVHLKYVGKMPAIHQLTRISKPGRRVYRKTDELKRVLSGQGMAIISTSVGLMTDREARARKLGGEILCEIS